MNKLLQEYIELPFWQKSKFALENNREIFRTDEFPPSEDDLYLFEDIFADQIDSIFSQEFDLPAIFDNYFQLENFYPAFYNKDVGSGSWIRIQTEKGFNIYWAKGSPQKRMSAERLNRNLMKIKAKMALVEKFSDYNGSLSKIKEISDLLNEIKIADYLGDFPHKLKYAKIMKTRTQVEYVLPHQYELASDIDLYTAAIQDKMNQGAVKYKSLFTMEDKDQIFYLQSRGIDKDTAILMCKLQQIYFKVDTAKLFANYMQKD